MQRPAKLPDLMARIRDAIGKGLYLDTRHATDRKAERNIDTAEILFVLRHGRHEAFRDRYHAAYESWAYAVRGKSVEKRELRVVIAFNTAGMLIITAIAFGD